MGQYRLSFYFKKQIGLLVEYDNLSNLIELNLPFVEIIIGLDSSAYGIRFFKD